MATMKTKNQLVTASKASMPVSELLAQIRNEIRGDFSGEKVNHLIDDVSNRVKLLQVEHEGMTEELLRTYEQLGIVFEVSRRVSTVQGEEAVVNLFLDTMRRSFDGRPTFAMKAEPDGSWVTRDANLLVENWIEELSDRARDSRRVVVGEAPYSGAGSEIAEAMVGPVFAGNSFVCSIVLTRGPDAMEFRASDMGLLDSLAIFCGDLIDNHRLVHELREMSVAMVRSLVNAVDQKDQYTSGHSMRVGYYATLLGKRLGLSEVELQMLQWSALLHDIGKIGIRDDVLKKTGKLSTEEFDHIKEHPVRSHRVVQGVPQLNDALAGVLHHHERFDGSGYPAGLKGKDIPLQARIIQIADVFDALTSTRSYRTAFDWKQALKILKEEAGTTVDPDLQKIFHDMIETWLEELPSRWATLVTIAGDFTYGEVTEPFESAEN